MTIEAKRFAPIRSPSSLKITPAVKIGGLPLKSKMTKIINALDNHHLNNALKY